MKDLYGYKEKDIQGLSEFIEKNQGKKKTELFFSYAKKVKKAEGTVRNMYYAMIRAGKNNNEFKDKYMFGLFVDVKKIEKFSADDERKLIKDILLLKREGKSVRCAVYELSGGDSKKALRYQNKYRNALAVKPELVEEIVKEINKEKGENIDYLKKPEKKRINEVQLRRLKNEIDGLVSRISESVKTENDYLKNRVMLLERENQKLYSALYEKDKDNNPLIKIFHDKDKNALN